MRGLCFQMGIAASMTRSVTTTASRLFITFHPYPRGTGCRCNARDYPETRGTAGTTPTPLAALPDAWIRGLGPVCSGFVTPASALDAVYATVPSACTPSGLSARHRLVPAWPQAARSTRLRHRAARAVYSPTGRSPTGSPCACRSEPTCSGGPSQRRSVGGPCGHVSATAAGFRGGTPRERSVPPPDPISA